MLAALDAGGGGARRRLVHVRAVRRGHPHRHRAPGDRARRRRGREAPHRSQSQRPGRDRRCGCSSARGHRRRPCACIASRRCSSTAPSRPATSYLPGYTHLQRAQPVLLAHHFLAHCWALRARRRPLARRRRPCRRVAARRRRARRLDACRSTPTRAAETSASRGRFDNSLDAVSDRDFVAEALFVLALTRRAPVAAGRGDRAVVDRGVRVPPPRRRLQHRLARCCRRRRTPTSPSWRAARPAG